MFKNNNYLDNVEFFALGAMIGGALFVGVGNTIMVQIAKQDTWIVSSIAMVVGLFLILLLCKIMNYEPNLNIIEKINSLFSKKIGFIINLLLAFLIFFVFVIVVWQFSIFANTKYLTETPLLFIAFLFLIPIFYSSTKGIETIARTTLLLLYSGIICHILVTTSLFKFIELKNIKPILVNGFFPIVEGVLKYFTYCIVPFITLLIIPKTKIRNNKYSCLSLILGYLFSSGIMTLVFFMDMSTVGYEIASMYKYPEYFIMKKVSIGNAIDNVENFLSVVWIYDLFVCAMMCLNYLKEYVSLIINKKSKKQQNIISLILSIIVMYLSSKIFINTTVANSFLKDKYPIIVGLTMFIIVILIILKIIFKKNKKII